MPAEIKLRKARRGDRDWLAALLRELGYRDAADTNTVFWVLNHPEIEVLVAVDHLDRPVGLLSLSYRPQLCLRGRIATIDELVVTPEWRNKGVGSKLLEAGLARAKSLAVKRVELNAQSAQNLRRSFFERHGLKESDCTVIRLCELERQS